MTCGSSEVAFLLIFVLSASTAGGLGEVDVERSGIFLSSNKTKVLFSTERCCLLVSSGSSLLFSATLIIDFGFGFNGVLEASD